MNKAVAVCAAFAVLFAAAAAAPAPGPLTIKISPENKSGESGTAVLTDTPAGVLVKLKLTGGAAGVPQPAHIHEGTCADQGNVKYKLTTVADGVSETTIPNVTIADLEKQPVVINVHKSTKEMMTYVACGNVVAAK